MSSKIIPLYDRDEVDMCRRHPAPHAASPMVPSRSRTYQFTYDTTPNMNDTTKRTTPDSAEATGQYDSNYHTKQLPAKEGQHAYTFLEEAGTQMKDRAVQRDTSVTGTGVGGERSMASTVKAFNALTKHNLTEAEGWEFMILLKLVRGRQGNFRMDDYVDAAAYSALLGECASKV